MKSLALAFIAKNEKENLIQCKYEKLFHLFDEVVMEDTGSTDGTVEYLSNFNVKISQYEWQNDFSFHRNRVLDSVESDYVFFIEPDMEFDNDLVDKVRALINQYHNEKIVISAVCTNLYDSGETNRFSNLTVFPQSQEMRFRGRIHENVSQSIEEGGYKVHTIEEAFFVHYGYYTTALMDAKVERNFIALKDYYKSNSNDPTTSFQYAVACFDTNSGDKGKSVFKDIIKKGTHHVEYSHMYLSYIYVAQKKVDVAYENIIKSSHLTDYPTVWNYRGFLEMAMNKFQESVDSYKKALKVLKIGNTDYALPLNEKREMIKSYEGLIISLFELKQYRDIVQISNGLSKISNISSEQIVPKIAKSYMEIGNITKAKFFLNLLKK